MNESNKALKTPYQLAKELKVSKQAVYKKISGSLANELSNHIQRTIDGKMLLDKISEEIIRSSFSQPVNYPIDQVTGQPVDQVTGQPVDQVTGQPDNQILQDRIAILEAELRTERERNQELTGKAESATNKALELADKLADTTSKVLELADRTAELAKANQVLLGIEQSKTNPALRIIDGLAEEPRKRRSFFDWFKKHS